MGFFNQPKWPQLELDEIRKRSRVLVIDDQEFPYKPLFERDGYRIDKWDDVEDLTKLETGYYDVVLLDIQGIGKSESRDQGLGVLRHIRNMNPTQIVVAYSNSDWPLKHQEFFKMANEVLDKRSDYIVFKTTLDALLRKRFSLEFYLTQIELAGSAHVQNTEKLRKVSQKAILSSNVSTLEKYLSKAGAGASVVKTLSQIAYVAIQVFKIAS